ncbi:LacI family DNA-binding transcriptional regulator [Bifidobacterium aemilianum]|uniref:LacI family DNA-binding transcriptional regulator n=1 Tax=Bifidobacterium aemilianum TaxID=2493120 RepID=UPI001F352ECB|nr:LacI family DNA-binding transcriptional regulator [Bifidobacterium aemilianum]
MAQELGISQTAVSFAINDRPGVSDETKRRVKEAAAAMGWSPAYAAQALGSSKTMTVGFAPARSADGFQTESFMLHFMAGIHSSLSTKGYGLLYRPCASLTEELATYRDWARRRRVDGVILVDLRADDPRPALLTELGLPAVLAGGPDPVLNIPSLSIDDSRTMRTILDHLAQMGHRSIAYLSGDERLDYSQARVEAFRSFAHKHALEASSVDFTDFDPATASALTQSKLSGPHPFTAFIYENETMAASSMRVLAEVMIRGDRGGLGGKRFPHGLPAMVSFEDSFVCEATYPSITAVHRDAGQYGTKVANLLCRLLAGEPVSGNRRILTPKLVVRESTRLTVDPNHLDPVF